MASVRNVNPSNTARLASAIASWVSATTASILAAGPSTSRASWTGQQTRTPRSVARQQARRTKDRPVVLTCELNKKGLRARYGSNRVFWRNGVIAVRGGVPVAVLRSYPAPADQPSSPSELAEWVNHVLRRKRHKGVSKRNPGIVRLSEWVTKRLAHRPKGIIGPAELLDMARRWLPEAFGGQKIGEKRLESSRTVRTIEVEAAVAGVAPLHEDQALELMDADDPKKRAKGLATLAEMGDPDLAEWCAMFFDDESLDMQVAALRTLLRCNEIEPEEPGYKRAHQECAPEQAVQAGSLPACRADREAGHLTDVLEEGAEHLGKTEVGELEIETSSPIVAEPFEYNMSLGRLILTKDGAVVGAGIVAGLR